jgi:hypothetical protein
MNSYRSIFLQLDAATNDFSIVLVDFKAALGKNQYIRLMII